MALAVDLQMQMPLLVSATYTCNSLYVFRAPGKTNASLLPGTLYGGMMVRISIRQKDRSLPYYCSHIGTNSQCHCLLPSFLF